jgi:hypothetical protein
MTAPLGKRSEMREIRAAIKSVLLVSPNGLGLRELTQNVYAMQPNATYDQVKGQVFKMQGKALAVDRSNSRNIYFLVGAAVEPPEPEHVKYRTRKIIAPPLESKKEVMPVKQRTVPATTGLFSGHRRSPIEWCVDVLGLMSMGAL